MIEIILGVVLGMIIGLSLPKIKNAIRPIKKVEISEEEKNKQEKIKKSFDELMQYDYDTALGGVRNE